MDDLQLKKEKIFKLLFALLFIIYILVLIRVILFKDMPLYNLFGGINGNTSYRNLNLLPFSLMMEIVKSGGMSPLWILKNIVGNIAIFTPMGLFLSFFLVVALKKQF